jgi:hypothetical protein
MKTPQLLLLRRFSDAVVGKLNLGQQSAAPHMPGYPKHKSEFQVSSIQNKTQICFHKALRAMWKFCGWGWGGVDRLCGPVVRVLAAKPEVPGSILGATRFSE